MFAQAAIQARSQTNSAEKGIYPGQASLFISRLPDSSRVSSTLYSSALCIFHIGSPFMFYVRQLRGEQLCGRRILSKFRGECEGEGERERENSFQWEKWSRMPNAASAVPANKQELQTKACLSYYITIIHGNNTSHAVTAVIWKQIDRIYKFSAYLRRDLRDLNLHCQLFGVKIRCWRLIRSCCRLFQDNLVLYIYK